MAPKAILCDLDGTVWDSFPWYSAVIAQETALSHNAILGELRRGCSIVAVCKHAGVTDTRFRNLCTAYGDALTLYPGVRDSLRALTDRRIATAAVTSLPARIAEPLLECSGIRSLFVEVVNASNCAARKPSPVPLTFALSRMGVEPERNIFYVGDQAGDAAAAHAAGLSFAWASYGYGGECPCASATVLKSFDEVLLL
jgi:phosphoglycolate phosphatase-like HAD superfamily hydrolase